MTSATVRAKVTGQLLTLDDALQDTVPAVLALFEALPADSPFLALDPLQRRRRTLEALKRLLLRESQVQPLLLVFEDLHWIDTETQAVLDSWSRACRPPGCCCWSTTARSISTAGAVKPTTPSSGSTPSPRRARTACSRRCWGTIASAGAPHAAPDCPHAGQSLLSGGECAHPGGDRGAGRGAGRLSPGPTARHLAGAGHGAGAAGGAHRSAAAGGQAPAPDRRRHRHRGALAAAAGHRRHARRGAVPQPGAPPGGGVPLRDQPVSRARLHLQARPHPRGGLREPAAGAAARAARAHRRGPGGAWRATGWTSRWSGWRTMPCGARCGTRPWPTGRQAGDKAMARSAYREAVACFEQALAALQHLPDSVPPPSRPSTSGSAYARVLNALGEALGGCSTTCAAPRPSPRRWAIHCGSGGSTPT